MMLCSEYDTFHTGFLAYARPLATIQTVRVEEFQSLIAVPPGLVCVGVQGVMDECIVLHLLPAQLIL